MYLVMADKIKINLADLLDASPMKIPVNECSIGGAQAAQSGREVTEKDPLVISIRDMGGLIHPIIVKKIESGYDIVTGQRRWNAHKLLNMSQIKSFVVERDLSDAERKVISFAENVGQKDMKHKDYVDVIEYFYDKYGGNVITTSINRYTYSIFHPRYDSKFQTFSPDFERHIRPTKLSKITIKNNPEIALAAIKYLKYQKGTNVIVCSDVPGGSGLGASSSLAVNLVYSISKLQGKKISNTKIVIEEIILLHSDLERNVRYKITCIFFGIRLTILNKGLF